MDQKEWGVWHSAVAEQYIAETAPSRSVGIWSRDGSKLITLSSLVTQLPAAPGSIGIDLLVCPPFNTMFRKGTCSMLRCSRTFVVV